MTEHRIPHDVLDVTLEEHESRLRLCLHDRAAGRTWGPVPLLRAWVHTRGLKRSEAVEDYQVHRIEPVDNGLHVTVGLSPFKIEFGLWLRVVDGELSVMLSPAEIYERMGGYFMLFRVDLLPGLITVGADGTVVLPLGSGVAFSPRGKPQTDDRFLLYLEQERWELVPTLPVCAGFDKDGGLIALARQCAADTECHVATDGHDAASVGFNVSLRRHWPDPVDSAQREIRLCPAAPGADPVPATAARLRRHVIEDCGKPTLKERVAEDEGLAYMVQAYNMKLFHGIENEGPICEAWDKSDPVSFRNCLTFAEALEGLKRIRAAGIDKVHTLCVGWNARGHDGLYPTRFPVEERIGGEDGFRMLCREGHALGHQINIHDNFVMNVPQAPDWDPELVVHDMYGAPLVTGWWGGGIEYQTWGLALPQERFDAHFARLKDIGIRGTYYVDYMPRPLEVNYHPRHKGPRGASERGQVRIYNEVRKAWGSVSTEMGTFPAAVACDYVAGIHHRARSQTWPVCHLLDRDVPLWDLTFHGLTLCEDHGAFEWGSVMRSALYAHHPRDEWSWRTPPMPVLDDQRIACQKAVYDLVLKRLGHLQLEAMTGWRCPADGVEETTYADGTAIVADFAARELFVNGDNVPCPDALGAGA